MTCLTSNIDGIVFDLEGVLVQAKSWHERALKEALNDYNYELNIEECYRPGLSTKELLTDLSKHGKCPTNLHDLWDKKQKITAKLINKECKKNKRIYEAVKFAHEFTNEKVALATNCSKETALLILDKLQLRDFFKAVLTSGDVTKLKPHPRMYLQACWDLGLRPRRCLAIDDSSIGFKSALDAKCRLMKIENFEDLTIESLKKALKALEIRI